MIKEGFCHHCARELNFFYKRAGRKLCFVCQAEMDAYKEAKEIANSLGTDNDRKIQKVKQ